MVYGKCLTKDLVQHVQGVFMFLFLCLSVSLQCIISLSTLIMLVFFFTMSFLESFSKKILHIKH